MASTLDKASGQEVCQALIAALGQDKVVFPGSEAYKSSVDSYFSQQARLEPLCIVQPRSTEDVSTAVRVLSSSPSTPHFAVRSGGHTGFAGAANINGGVTIDLRLLNSIELNDDKSIASVGPGATWGEVYAKLDPLGLGVAGGRAAQVGVGGLTTGGGISYMSPRYGWTCDTVSSYEVVLADGSVVEAKEDNENADLLVALRGGSNNFGIVTRISLRTFEQGPLWGGSVYHDLSTIDDQLKAFVDINSADNYDEYASLITSFGFAAGKGSAVVNSIEYTKAEENPAVFAPIMKIPALFSTMRLDTMTNISIEQGAFSVRDARQLSAVTTHASTLPILKAVYQRLQESLPSVEEIPGIMWSISLEPLPPAIYARAPPGSNSFGLSDRRPQQALVVTLLSATWTRESDDARVEQAARALFDAIESDAKRLDAYDPFVYLNYAAPWQEPIASYGPEAVDRLRQVRDRVDPKGVFTTQVPGPAGFKIPM